MVKNNKIVSNKNSSNDYQIKTRNRHKKLTSMSRELKNIKENNWLQKINSKDLKSKNTKENKAKNRIKTKFVKKLKKIDKKIININLEEKSINSNHDKKGKNVIKKIELKKTHVEINKYRYQGNEYFDFKEVIAFLYDQFNINLDSPNNKVKDKEDFKIKMNALFNTLFVIYFNKIFITETNLYKFLNFLSEYIKLDAKEVIRLLNLKNTIKTIEENIILEQYFKPRLILMEK